VQVLRLAAKGRANKEISSTSFISEHTVAKHLQNIFTKLGVSSRTEATAYAFEPRLTRQWSNLTTPGRRR
jgi:DNA-binding NarL/FixJ family response regulator